MIEMVLVYCLVARPQQCTEQRPVFEEPLSGFACLANAQSIASSYVLEHPEWQLARWRCEIDKPRGGAA
jgi:hypothetical protein